MNDATHSPKVEEPGKDLSGSEGGGSSFHKMARILDCFTRTRSSLSLTDLVERTDLPRTTIHRIVASLREIGMIDQDGRRGDYRLGLRMFHYGSVVMANLDLNRHAHPHVLALHQVTGEIVHLHMFDGSQMVCIEREEMGEVRNTTITVIEAAPVHSTSVGKAFLAFQDEDLVRRIIAEEGLEARTKSTLSTFEALSADLTAIRERGYSLDLEEDQIGVQCVGAPIRDSRSRVFGAISVSGPASRMPLARLQGLSSIVIQTADRISEELGWNGGRM